MKYGIIAHINSDIIALKAALHKMESAKVEQVVCAGNVVEKPIMMAPTKVIATEHHLQVTDVTGVVIFILCNIY